MATMGEPETVDGWRLLDGVSFICGTAVALVHLRPKIAGLESPDRASVLILGVSFVLLSVTAAGPFVFLVRRFVLRPEGYPGPADLCWPAQGLPWLILALARSAQGMGSPTPIEESLGPWGLFGLLPAAAYALLTVARRWQASRPLSETSTVRRGLTHTGFLSLALAATWPLQIALWMLLSE